VPEDVVVGELAFRASLPRTGTASRDARHDLASWLPQRCGPAAAETAVLLTSELVTNAVVHTRSADLALRARCDGDTLLVAVDDEAATPPVCCDDGPTGAGLALVDSLAARWGWERLGAGKRVWFEVRCAGRGAATPDRAPEGDHRGDATAVR
jgi:anti-sigma regulatory factor (Ser/Thr protein kinase)